MNYGSGAAGQLVKTRSPNQIRNDSGKSKRNHQRPRCWFDMRNDGRVCDGDRTIEFGKRPELDSGHGPTMVACKAGGRLAEERSKDREDCPRDHGRGKTWRDRS